MLPQCSMIAYLDFLAFGGLDAFSATAALIRAFNAFSLIGSPSRISMARRVPPSRLALKRPAGSLSAAPLANVSLILSF